MSWLIDSAQVRVARGQAIARLIAHAARQHGRALRGHRGEVVVQQRRGRCGVGVHEDQPRRAAALGAAVAGEAGGLQLGGGHVGASVRVR